MPAWIGAGLADWWHHRRTRIADTSGTRESAILCLMMAEAAVPTMLGLFCQVDAEVLATAGAAVAVREAMACADVAFAQSRCRVSPGEQQIHNLLEVVPTAATALLVALRWDQAAALAGRERARPDLRLHATMRG